MNYFQQQQQQLLSVDFISLRCALLSMHQLESKKSAAMLIDSLS